MINILLLSYAMTMLPCNIIVKFQNQTKDKNKDDFILPGPILYHLNTKTVEDKFALI